MNTPGREIPRQVRGDQAEARIAFKRVHVDARQVSQIAGRNRAAPAQRHGLSLGGYDLSDATTCGRVASVEGIELRADHAQRSERVTLLSQDVAKTLHVCGGVLTVARPRARGVHESLAL